MFTCPHCGLMHLPIPDRFGPSERATLLRPKRKQVPCMPCANAISDYAARARAHRERCMTIEVEGFYTWGDLKRLMHEQDGRCAYCGIGIEHEYHVEHKTPLSRGGDNSANNIQLTCPTCNLRKHVKTDEEFKKMLDAQNRMCHNSSNLR